MSTTFSHLLFNKLELNPSRVHFELVDKARHLVFTGQAANGVIMGMVEESGKEFPFRLDWMARTHPSRYTGIYKVDLGRFIKIGTARYQLLMTIRK